MCTKDFLRARARAGFGAGCAAAHVVAHVCPSSTSVPRAASAASSCSCKQRCVASPVGPWAGGARAGLTGAVRGAAAAHAIDAVLLLHHERQHVVLHLPCDRRRPWRRVVHLVVRRARMLERAWRCSMEWGRVPPPRAARRARAATRPCCACGAHRPCSRRARDLLRRTDAPSAIVKFEFSRPAVLLVRQAAPGLRCLPQPAGAAKIRYKRSSLHGRLGGPDLR